MKDSEQKPSPPFSKELLSPPRAISRSASAACIPGNRKKDRAPLARRALKGFFCETSPFLSSPLEIRFSAERIFLFLFSNGRSALFLKKLE